MKTLKGDGWHVEKWGKQTLMFGGPGLPPVAAESKQELAETLRNKAAWHQRVAKAALEAAEKLEGEQ